MANSAEADCTGNCGITDKAEKADKHDSANNSNHAHDADARGNAGSIPSAVATRITWMQNSHHDQLDAEGAMEYTDSSTPEIPPNTMLTISGCIAIVLNTTIGTIMTLSIMIDSDSNAPGLPLVRPRAIVAMQFAVTVILTTITIAVMIINAYSDDKNDNHEHSHEQDDHTDNDGHFNDYSNEQDYEDKAQHADINNHDNLTVVSSEYNDNRGSDSSNSRCQQWPLCCHR